jgi:hypothetical protein
MPLKFSLVIFCVYGIMRALGESEPKAKDELSASLYLDTLGTKPNGSPIISVQYHLTNGETLVLSVNEDTVWWNNSSHAMKESKIAFSILNTLYFSQS